MIPRPNETAPLFQSSPIVPRKGSFTPDALREAMGMPDPKGSHPTHAMHANSRAAFRTLDLGERQRQVCEALHGYGRPMTDREIAMALGSRDPNRARPRVTELVDSGVLVEVGNVEDGTTRRRVRRVWFAEGKKP